MTTSNSTGQAKVESGKHESQREKRLNTHIIQIVDGGDDDCPSLNSIPQDTDKLIISGGDWQLEHLWASGPSRTGRAGLHSHPNIRHVVVENNTFLHHFSFTLHHVVDMARLKTLDLSGAIYMRELSLKKRGRDICFSSIQRLVLPPNLTIIGEYELEGLEDLKELIIPPTVRSIKKSGLANSGLESITIPAATQVIEYGAFSGSAKLETLRFEGPLQNIQICAWSILLGCAGLCRVETCGDLRRPSFGATLWPRLIHHFLISRYGRLARWGVDKENRQTCLFQFLIRNMPQIIGSEKRRQAAALKKAECAKQTMYNLLTNQYSCPLEKREDAQILLGNVLHAVGCPNAEEWKNMILEDIDGDDGSDSEDSDMSEPPRKRMKSQTRLEIWST